MKTPPRPPTVDRQVCVRSFDDPASADLAKHLLLSSGIGARLAGAQTVAGADLPAMTRGIRLFVDEDDVETAEALLGPEHALEPDEADDDPGPRCPKCESTYVGETWSSGEIVLGVLGLGLPFRWMQKKVRCDTCGHAFASLSASDASASQALSAPASYRSAPRRPGNPVFRLRRRYAVAGAGAGLAGGAALAGMSPTAAVWFLVLGPVAGALLGGSRYVDVCSKPGCRAPLPPDAVRCPRCDGEIAGTISRPEQHFARKAAWHRGAEVLDD